MNNFLVINFALKISGMKSRRDSLPLIVIVANVHSISFTLFLYQSYKFVFFLGGGGGVSVFRHYTIVLHYSRNYLF